MKQLFMTVISASGKRTDAVVDLPAERPERDLFDQYAILRSDSGHYEVHVYLNGMDYTLIETSGLVNVLMSKPLVRSLMMGRVVPLETDYRWNCLLITDELDKPSYQVLNCRSKGELGCEIDLNFEQYPKAGYPLEWAFDVWRTIGYEVDEIPPAAAGPKSRGYVAIHPSAGIEKEVFAISVMEWLYKGAPRPGTAMGHLKWKKKH